MRLFVLLIVDPSRQDHRARIKDLPSRNVKMPETLEEKMKEPAYRLMQLASAITTKDDHADYTIDDMIKAYKELYDGPKTPRDDGDDDEYSTASDVTEGSDVTADVVGGKKISGPGMLARQRSFMLPVPRSASAKINKLEDSWHKFLVAQGDLEGAIKCVEDEALQHEIALELEKAQKKAAEQDRQDNQPRSGVRGEMSAGGMAVPDKAGFGEDSSYACRQLAGVLAVALAEVNRVKPADPIEYLGLWLKNYAAGKGNGV